MGAYRLGPEQRVVLRDRLRALADVSDEALCHPVDGEWTVAAKLAHLAFWEARQVGVLEAWRRHGLVPAWWTAEEAHAVNAARLPSWLALPPRVALAQALAAADALDQVMAELPGELLAQLPWRRQEPALHRGEHLDEIERALAARRQLGRTGA
jgi:hypothetical protein